MKNVYKQNNNLNKVYLNANNYFVRVTGNEFLLFCLLLSIPLYMHAWIL